MKYKIPKLYRTFPLEIMEALCVSGHEALSPPSCTAGPEAGAGGCAPGVAASSRCLSGTAAGTKCEMGTGFD